MNIVILFGRLTSDVEIMERNGKTLAKVRIAVPRDFKNVNGDYDTDFINCTLWELQANVAQSFCKKGMAVMVKGRLVESKIELDNGKYLSTLDFYGEQLSIIPNEKMEPISLEL